MEQHFQPIDGDSLAAVTGGIFEPPGTFAANSPPNANPDPKDFIMQGGRMIRIVPVKKN